MLRAINAYGISNQELLPPKNLPAQAKPEISTPTQELPNLSTHALEIRKFADGIKGANDMIGAMQIADMTLSGLSSQAQSTQDLTQETLQSFDKIAEASRYKNESVFGKELRINLAGEPISLSLPLPSQMQKDKESLIASLAQKHDEINTKLAQISQSIQQVSMPNQKAGQTFDFENFDANEFKSLFGK